MVILFEIKISDKKYEIKIKDIKVSSFESCPADEGMLSCNVSINNSDYAELSEYITNEELDESDDSNFNALGGTNKIIILLNKILNITDDCDDYNTEIIREVIIASMLKKLNEVLKDNNICILKKAELEKEVEALGFIWVGQNTAEGYYWEIIGDDDVFLFRDLSEVNKFIFNKKNELLPG